MASLIRELTISVSSVVDVKQEYSSENNSDTVKEVHRKERSCVASSGTEDRNV